MAASSDQQLRNPPLSDQARDRLRAAILQGELKPGEKINIEKVAATFGISRTPIREALKALETEGLVQIHANRGAVVEPQVWQEIHHRYRMRALLEGYAAELSCEKRDPDLIADLQKICSQVRSAGDSFKVLNTAKAHAIAEMNRSFHRTIWLGSGSVTLVRFLEALDLPKSFNDSIYRERALRDTVCQHHDAIVNAFVDGDCQRARTLMESHIQESATLLASHAGDNVGELCC